MRFMATNKQVKHLLAVATNASLPVAMSHMHYERGRIYSADDFNDASVQHGVDYVGGRMVKLRPRQIGDDLYEIREPEFDDNDMELTYQSWGRKYRNAEGLIRAAGLVPEEDAK